MTDQEVKEIVASALKVSSETNQLEFKDSRGGYPNDTWQSVSSFSHRPGGGYIVFGIAEHRDGGKTKFSMVGAGDISTIQEKVSDL